MGCTTDRELHPAPKVDIQLSKIIPLQTHRPARACSQVQVDGAGRFSSVKKPARRIELLFSFYNALNRADRDALRRIMVTDAFHAGRLVDDV